MLLTFIIKRFEKAIELVSSSKCSISNVDSLEAVAGLRVAFKLAADLLHQHVTKENWMTGPESQIQGKMDQLLGLLHKAATKMPSVYPWFFFLRQLLRNYGSADLRMIVQKEEFDWLWSFQDNNELVRILLLTFYFW